MKAAVCYEFNKPLVVEDVDIDSPGKREVKVKLATTAICHSDIHVFRGELPFPLPAIGGHESAGYIEEVGEGVTKVKPGDRVVASLLSACGECLFCTTGRTHQCEKQWNRNPFKNKKGENLTQMFNIGSFAEYTVLDESQVVKIPDDMPLEQASLLACGVITGFGAVVNRAKPEVMSSCIIVGVGGVGLNSVQGAALSGAYPVIAMDINDDKLEAAKTFGATHTINSKKVDAKEEVMKLTGRGADYVFVTVGSAAAMEQGFSLSGPCSMTVLVGLPNVKDSLNFQAFQFIREERVLTGSFMGTTHLETEIPKLVELYKAGKLKLDELISNRYSLDQINEAIEEVERGDVLRNIINF